MNIKINNILIPATLVDRLGKEHVYPSSGWEALAKDICEQEDKEARERARVKRYFKKEEKERYDPLEDLRAMERDIEKRIV